MPTWVACVARAHVDRGGGAVTVEKEALRASSFALELGDFVAIHHLVTDAHHISSLLIVVW
jgi:hypothetical protein